MGWLLDRLVLQTDARYLHGFGDAGAPALDGRLGASLVLPMKDSNASVQVGAFATVGASFEGSAKAYGGGGVAVSVGLAVPSTLGATLAGEVLTRGGRVTATLNLPVPVLLAYYLGASPRVSVGYLHEWKTDFSPGAKPEEINGFVLSAGFDLLPKRWAR